MQTCMRHFVMMELQVNPVNTKLNVHYRTMYFDSRIHTLLQKLTCTLHHIKLAILE